MAVYDFFEAITSLFKLVFVFFGLNELNLIGKALELLLKIVVLIILLCGFSGDSVP